MKIQIDTTAKTIKLESCEKLSALFDFLTKFFPDGDWEDYELQTNTTIVNCGNQIIVNPSPIWVNPYQYGYGEVLCGTDTVATCDSRDITSGASNAVLNVGMTDIANTAVFNIEMN